VERLAAHGSLKALFRALFARMLLAVCKHRYGSLKSFFKNIYSDIFLSIQEAGILPD
jgi:hypothetical protein